MDRGTGSGGDDLSHLLDDRTRALVCLGALMAIGGGTSCYQRQIAGALEAGATDEEVLGVLLAVAPTIGMAGLVSSTVRVARGLGYDIDGAFEHLHDVGDQRRRGRE